MFRANRLKARLKAGEPSLGCWLFLPGADHAEVLAQAGFDALIVDHEHTPGDLRHLVAQLRAIQAYPTTALVRVAQNDPVAIKQVLDAGVEGVIVPLVETAEDARRAVAACRYPPAGMRGSAQAVARAADYGRRKDYAGRAAEELVIVVQVETVAAVANLPDILAVDGLDAVFIGPGDLAASLGRPGAAADDPEVADLIGEIERQVLGHGVALAGITAQAREARRMIERGYGLVTPATDVWLVRDGARDVLDALRASSGQA